MNFTVTHISPNQRSRNELEVEVLDQEVEVFVESGDNCGRGVERHAASIRLTYEEARGLVEYLESKLYGD